MILDDVDATAAKIGHAETTRILHANDMKYVELEFSSIGISRANAVSASDEYRRKIFRVAEFLGARNVKVAPGLPENIRDPRPEELHSYVQRMQEAFVGLCRDAAAHGTAIVLEIMPFSNVRTLEAGRAIVEGANQPNGFDDLAFGARRYRLQGN